MDFVGSALFAGMLECVMWDGRMEEVATNVGDADTDDVCFCNAFRCTQIITITSMAVLGLAYINPSFPSPSLLSPHTLSPYPGEGLKNLNS